MIDSCIDIMMNAANNQLDKFIIDNYAPVNGTYIIYEETRDGFQEKAFYEVKIDKKTGMTNLLDHEQTEIAKLDYPSLLVSTNKAIGQKIILSNNFLSFFIKKESLTNGKLTMEIIDKYYSLLSDPLKRYRTPKDKMIYQYAEEQTGPINQEKLTKIYSWVKANIFSIPHEISGTGYLKIFFLCNGVDIELEGRRHIIPSFYNKNEYNEMISNQIYGVPDQNLGLDNKKPFLRTLTRRNTVPQLLNVEHELRRKKLFDYLWSEACKGKYFVFFDSDRNKIYAFHNLKEKTVTIENGIFLYIRKDKTEAAIEDMDLISGCHRKMGKVFEFENILNLPEHQLLNHQYGRIMNTNVFLDMIDQEIYLKNLVNQFYSDINDILPKNNPILKSLIIQDRNVIFDWMYKGRKGEISIVLLHAAYTMLLDAIKNDARYQIKHLFNLYISLQNYFEGNEKNMGDIIEIRNKLRDKINTKGYESINDDSEYYYAVGQLISYFISLNKSSKKMHSLLNPFLNVKEDQQLKEKLKGLFLKYNYIIETNNKRFNNMYQLITTYVPKNKINKEFLIAGYISNNLIYERREEEINHE